MSPELSRADIEGAVAGRLMAVLPRVTDVAIEPGTPPSKLDLRFRLEDKEHRFWMHRSNGLWYLDDHRVNGTAQPRLFNGEQPRFEQLIFAVLNTTKRPKPKVVELRCPEDARRMFGKIIVQRSSSSEPPNLLEFSCPQCKRTTGRVTMHVFQSTDGKLVKTQANEPWTRREPKPWSGVSQREPAVA